MSKGSKFKNNLANKLKDKAAGEQEAQAEPVAVPEAVNEIYEGPEEMVYRDDLVEEDLDKDQVSVATEVVDGLSVAPTEMLANEYKKLVEQYEIE